MKKFLCLLLVLSLVPAFFASCSSEDLTDDEVREIAGPLIEQSYEINEIFFGKGLPHEEDAEGPLDETQYDVKPVKYLVVLSDKYISIDSLKDAAREVYTEGYLDSVFDTAFNGVRDSNGEIVQYARYFESFFENLKIRSDVEEDNIVVGRTYDVSTLKITDQAENYVFFTVESCIDGEDAGEIELSIKDEGNGWRLDSPTY